jgi:hypothetical protein
MKKISPWVWLGGGFVLYELIAWQVNGKRVAQSLATTGTVPALLPLDLIGQWRGYSAPAPPATVAGFLR